MLVIFVSLKIDLHEIIARFVFNKLYGSSDPSPPHLLFFLVYIRENPVRHTSAVYVPSQPVFGSTLFFITGLSVNQ